MVKDQRKVHIIGTRGYPSYYGGFETAVRKIAPFFADRGWDVLVYGRPGSVKADDPSRDTRVHSRETRGLHNKSLSTLSYGLSATIYALRTRPDVALVMNVANGYFLPLLRLRKIRTIVNVDGIEWEREKWGKLARLTFRIGAKLTARYADSLVFDSLEIERYWKERFQRDGVFIPYGGESSAPIPLKDDLPINGYVLMVARFVPENTVSEFFEAAKTISKKHPVVIVGSSGYGGSLDAVAQDLSSNSKSIQWLGHISDDSRLHALWQNAGLYFHGHSVGGTNPTLVQAMALGTPVLARDTVYNREVLGQSGVFVKPDARDIAATAVALMDDVSSRDDMSGALMARAQEHYNWSSVCDLYEKLASSVLK